MLLLLTNSLDATSDEIVRRVGCSRVFRLNVDQWRSYELRVDVDGFEIVDPLGRLARERDVRACYVRKPSFDDPIDVPASGSPEAWIRAEVSYVIGELYGMCRERGLVRLVERGAVARVGKLQQLRVAAKYFETPRWAYHWGRTARAFEGDAVAKPLGADFVDDWRFFYTTGVDPRALDVGFPWFLQSRIQASHDVTIVFVDGELFAFSLDRNGISGVDWRQDIFTRQLDWRRMRLDDETATRVRALMNELGLRFGRIDLLQRGEQLLFLEVNPNGQWAWLDLHGREGIFDAVVGRLLEGWG
jgi:hypothetical protein